MIAGDTTSQLIDLLRRRHTTRYQGEWATFVELRVATGYNISEQRIDFFAIHTWPSKYFRSIAYEVKASRSDFLRELKNPRKREIAELFANECYFVAPKGIIKLDEVPADWGLLEPIPGSKKLCQAKTATSRMQVEWPHFFTVAIARRCADPMPTQQALWKEEGELQP